MSILKKSTTLPLEERIRSIQAEASAAIDEFVLSTMDELRKSSNDGECGIPEAAIRQGFMRGSGDVCTVYLRLKRERDEQAAREKAA